MRPHSQAEQIRKNVDMLCDPCRIVKYNAAAVSCALFELNIIPDIIPPPVRGIAGSGIVRCRSPPL